MEQIEELATNFLQRTIDYMQDPVFLVQVGVVAVLVLIAVLVAKILVPPLKKRARHIERMPGLLRFIVVLLRRLQWLVLAALLAITYALGEILLPDQELYFVYGSLLLTAAWFTISVLSQIIRNRTLRKAFAVSVWIYVATLIMGIADDIALLLDSAAFSAGNFRISVLGVLQAAVFLGALLWISFSTGNFLDRRIQGVDELTPSLRVLLGKILRIAIIFIAVLVAMSGLGIDLTAFTVLSGAVGVGIGFGLQKVVSNFISGIIILLDQSIKPGDTITLGETFGWIRELRARFVSVVTRDGREYLIPNEDFITREVVNWSFSDKYVRLDVPFGVAYSSDPHEVTRLAIEAAASVDRVDSKFNTPVCWMTEFGDSSINFLLRFWIDDPQQGLTNVRGKVLLALWDTFKANGIGIPFPHREVIMKTPVTIEQGRT